MKLIVWAGLAVGSLFASYLLGKGFEEIPLKLYYSALTLIILHFMEKLDAACHPPLNKQS